jgi:2-keto-4-pentenoate hydratase/2-oxohepta-3-ene-1,7-dioic acid hydratase in catechol pathway
MKTDNEVDALSAKNFPGSALVGNYFTLNRPGAVRPNYTLWTKVNGRLSQAGYVEQMHFGPVDLLGHASRFGLTAGDMIACGSPPPSPEASAGTSCSHRDSVEMGIEGLGLLAFELA